MSDMVSAKEVNIDLFKLSPVSKREYLESSISRIYKILHLIEEEHTTGYSPRPFIAGQIFELGAADALFDGKLSTIIIKLKGIYDNYDSMELSDCKKQIFEIKRIINALLKNLEG